MTYTKFMLLNAREYNALILGGVFFVLLFNIKNIHAQNVTESNNMSFGRIILVSGGGDVILSPSGQTTTTGSMIASGSPAPGTFDIVGTPNTPVSISFSNQVFLNGPGQNMGLRDFNHNAGGTPTLNNLGQLQFNVGARLIVRASQAQGSYAGTYDVTVNY